MFYFVRAKMKMTLGTKRRGKAGNMTAPRSRPATYKHQNNDGTHVEDVGENT